MSVTVRRIRPDEGARFRSVRLAALADAPYAFGSTVAREEALTDADWVARAARSSEGAERAMFFALTADRVVGLAGGYRESPDERTVELISMWTAPETRRQGVGRLLVRTVIDWGVSTAATGVGLWVTAGNEPAQRLYTELGFRETGEAQPLPSDPTRNEVRMTLGV